MNTPLKQDSNMVGLFMAREVNQALPANPAFRTAEPNTYSKFGGDYKKVARNPFNPSRQNKKGTTSDLDTSGGWNEDVTQNNMFDYLEGFFFAAMRRKAFTSISAVDSADSEFAVVSAAGFSVGDIVLSAGFSHGANNGAKHVTAVAGNNVTVAEALIAENVPVGAVRALTRVGRRAAAGDASLSIVGNLARLAFAAFDPTTLGLIPGEWVAVGGDLAVSQFDGVRPFYGRVNSVDGDGINFDKTTATIAADAGAGKTIEIYVGFFVKNEDDPDLIVKSMFTLERPLGKDDDGRQSDNLQHFVFNTLKWNSPLSNKVTVDITGVGLDYDTRTGAEGLLSAGAGATVTKALGEEAINTSVNVFRMRLSIVDPDTLNPTPLFAKATEWSSTINNNVTAAKAQGDLGGFDTTPGQFAVQVTMTAYFQTVAAIDAIKFNDDCTFDAIYAKDNAAIYHDYPLLSLGGGELTIAQNQPIMLPLTNDAAESPFGHTALIGFFPFVPSVLMARGG